MNLAQLEEISMISPTSLNDMNAVECQALIFALEYEVELLDERIKQAVQRGAELVADCMTTNRDFLISQIKEATHWRDKR